MSAKAKQITDNAALMLSIQERCNDRGSKLKLDGWGGDATRRELDKHFPRLTQPHLSPTPLASPTGAESNSTRHYDFAKQYLGLREQPGPGTNPLLVPMFDLAPDWLDQDDSETAWCGIFRGWIAHKCATGLPAEHFRAASWAKWGRAVNVADPSTWQRGDTIIMTRPGGNHVCLLDRVAGAYVHVLGGNQENAVTIAKYLRSRVTAVRR